jgi:hypothetical protein
MIIKKNMYADAAISGDRKVIKKGANYILNYKSKDLTIDVQRM